MGSLVLTGDTSGSGTITVPAVAGTFTATIGSATGTHFPFTAGTAVASTSGTSIDFTSIPSWVKRITVMFAGVSTNGTSIPILQIGSGSFTTSGYLGSTAWIRNAGSPVVVAVTAGMGLVANPSISDLNYGHAILTLISSNTWVMTFNGSQSGSITTLNSGSSIALGGVLDRVRITTVNGTDTFDAGSINILYE